MRNCEGGFKSSTQYDYQMSVIRPENTKAACEQLVFVSGTIRELRRVEPGTDPGGAAYRGAGKISTFFVFD